MRVVVEIPCSSNALGYQEFYCGCFTRKRIFCQAMSMDLLFGKPLYIAVVGIGDEDQAACELAFEVGRLIGARGAVLICGGLGGVMNAAAKGAKETDGVTIGILPGKDREGASRYLDYALPTGLGHARNSVIAHAADGLVAVGGGFGTLSEIALALKLGKHVVGLDTWKLVRNDEQIDVFPSFEEPTDAVEALFNLLRGGRKPSGQQ